MIAKRVYCRSTKLREAFRKIPCQHCGRDDGTVVGAHSNSCIHGKGMGLKADDRFQASLCFYCHSSLDQGKQYSEEERRRIFWDAHVASVKELCARGLWPKDIPVPDITEFPWGERHE